MKGVGTFMFQNGSPVIYDSKTLTPVETGYSNIERELISVVFGLERLHHYVFDSKVKVQTNPQATSTLMEEVNCSS